MADARRVAAERRGRIAELLAEGLLRLKGYQIIARRAKTSSGEIDLIAAKGRMLVFVEVKQRPSLEAGLEAVPASSWRRIARAADSWTARHAPDRFDWDRRFDLIVVFGKIRICHMKDTWRPDSALT